MKPVISSAIVLAAAAMAAPAFASPGPEVEIRHAVARVAVIVEDRTDVAVEVEQGTSGLPAIRVSRDGNQVSIDGGLRRRGFLNRSDGIRNCRSGAEDGQPGAGASVEVRDIGRVNLSDAPLIVIRTATAAAGTGMSPTPRVRYPSASRARAISAPEPQMRSRSACPVPAR